MFSLNLTVQKLETSYNLKNNSLKNYDILGFFLFSFQKLLIYCLLINDYLTASLVGQF